MRLIVDMYEYSLHHALLERLEYLLLSSAGSRRDTRAGAGVCPGDRDHDSGCHQSEIASLRMSSSVAWTYLIFRQRGYPLCRRSLQNARIL